MEIEKLNNPMKITKSAISPAPELKVNRHLRAFLRRRLDSALGFAISACFLTAVGSSRAEEPAFLTTPSAISPMATSTQAQAASADLNEADMSQIINQIDESQFQLNAAAAQTSAQRSVFAPQTLTIGRAK